MSRLLCLARRPQPGDRRLLVSALGALLITMLALGSVIGAAAAARQLDADDPSPAQGHAQVVAHGVAAMPANEVAWRVTRATAPRPADAPDQDALGFVVADDDALLLNDLDSGVQTRLAAGEATFVAAGSRHQQIALGDGSVAYYRIELVAAGDGGDANGGELADASESFAAPDGNRDLDLVRDTLAQDEEAELALGSEDTPAVLLVTAGAVELVSADDDSAEPTPLSAGEAASVTGPVTVRVTGDEGATFVAAVVGPEVLEIERESPSPATPEVDTASVAVEAFGCPVAYEGDDFASDCTEALPDLEFVVGIPATNFSVTGMTDGDGEVIFEDLGENTYFLIGGVPAEFAVQTVICADADGPIPTEPTQSEIPGAVFDLAAGDEITCSWYVVPEDLRGEESGTIALSVSLCPTAETPLDSCQPGDITAPLTFSGPIVLSTGPDSDVPVNINGASYVWGEVSGVPYGTYSLIVDMPAPSGYTLDRVAGSLGGSDIGYAVVVDADTPNAIVSLIYVETAAGGPDLGNDGVDMNCGDFAELNAAQGYFVTDGGSAERNVDDMDANRNGLACEPGDDADTTEPTANV